MRDLSELMKYKIKHPTRGWGKSSGGCFKVPSPLQTNQDLIILASNSEGWDHVSVSMKKRIPTWTEMDFIKRLFFKDDEVVMQLHPAVGCHINIMENCLHLWRPLNEKIPLPPEAMV